MIAVCLTLILSFVPLENIINNAPTKAINIKIFSFINDSENPKEKITPTIEATKSIIPKTSNFLLKINMFFKFKDSTWSMI